MAKLEITLRQDTPMWHFRPDEKGCCLRASEVKPKLDKFIIKKYNDKPEGIKEIWKLKNQDKKSNDIHLDYKMSFEAIGERKIYCVAKNKNNFAPFFGNNCRREDEQFFNFKGLIYYPHGVKMTIFSLHGDLVNEINKYICEFFACHSFGTRQSKGFGCFYPKEIKLNNQDIKVLPCPIIINAVAQYKFQFQQNEINSDNLSTNFNYLFSAIENFHKKIRSGINLPNKYFKSLMFSYAKKKEYNWDKPQIRHYFGLKDDHSYFKKQYKKKCGKRNIDYNDGKPIQSDWNCPRKNMEEDYKNYTESEPYKFTKDKDGCIPLFRDALGLSGTQSWLYYKAEVNITDSQPDKNKKVTRFKTPFLYRPVKNSNGSYTIYIIFNEDDQENLNKLKKVKFRIDANKKENNTKKPINGYLYAKIYQGFDLTDYFDFLTKQKGINLKSIKP